jgi:hypothetical protein
VNARLRIETGRDRREVRLDDYLDAAAHEDSEEAAIAWIKAVRRAAIDGLPFRARFRYHGDSLWWFAELYLHKRGTIAAVLRQMRAIDALLARERPIRIDLVHGDDITRLLLEQSCRRLGLAYAAGDPGLVRLRTRRVLRLERVHLAPAAPQTAVDDLWRRPCGGVRSFRVLAEVERRRVLHRTGPACPRRPAASR